MNSTATISLVVLVIGGSAILAFSPKSHPTPAFGARPVEHAAVVDDLDLGNGARLRVVEIPDRIMPYRCVILTTAERTTMQCPADAAAP